MLNGTEISNASCLFPDMNLPNLILKKKFIHQGDDKHFSRTILQLDFRRLLINVQHFWCNI